MGLLEMLNQGGGLFDPQDRGFDLQKMMANTEPPAAPQFAPPQERGQGRGGLFGSGYGGEDIMSMLLRAAAIAQGDLGAGAQFGANIGAKARAEAEAATKRQNEWQDWRQRQDYTRENQAPAMSDYAQSLIDQGLQPGTPEFQQGMAQYNQSRADPSVATTLPGDRFYSGPRSGLAAALGGVTGGTQPKSAPPPEAIADLKRNPGSAAQFDEIFGESQKYLGGGTGNGAGGFPRR
jgi:hypothetical protein